jgi:hypothetical protein
MAVKSTQMSAVRPPTFQEFIAPRELEIADD